LKLEEPNSSPLSEFAYEDAYNCGDEFGEAISKQRKTGKSKAKKSRRSSIMLIPPSDLSSFEFSGDVEKDLKYPTNLVTSLTESNVNTTVTPAASKKVMKRTQAVTSKAQLSSDDLLMRKIESEKAVEFTRTMKARKLYLLLKKKSMDHPPAAATTTTMKRKEKMTKKLQIRIKPYQALAMRSRKVISKKTVNGNTIVEPFQFATDKRIVSEPKLNSAMSCATPVAEKAIKFMKDARSHGAPEQAARHITQPKSPYLRTKRRGDYAAKSKPKSREEMLDEEMTAIKSKPFKARPLDKRIFESSGELGVPKVAARPVTEPSCFELRSDARAKQPRIHIDHDDQTTSSATAPSTIFKARPLPAYVTDKSKIPILPVPACKTDFKSTVAVSPKFHALKRSTSAPFPNRRSDILEAKSKGENAVPKKSMPLKLTEPQEFKLSTDSRGEYYQRQLQRQIEQEEQRKEAARTVHATPIPKSSRSGFNLQPKVSVNKIPSTEVKPFNLRSEHRHTEVQEELNKRVNAIETELQKNTQFHARPVPSTTYKPNAVIVDNSERDLVIPMSISLESDKRALKRFEFDKQMEEKLAQIQEMKNSLVKQQHDMETKRIQEMRRKSIDEGGMLFKAQPILSKDLYPAKPVTTPVQCTTPFSPNLRTKVRSMLRSSVDANGNGGVDSQNGRGNTTYASSAKPCIAAKTINSHSVDATSHQRTVLTAAIQLL